MNGPALKGHCFNLLTSYIVKPFTALSAWMFLFVCTAEHGFINLTEGEDPVKEVREGESLTLSVNMTSYPNPSDVNWTYNNQQLKNTSDHVITLHNQQYRYTQTHNFVVTPPLLLYCDKNQIC